MRQCTPRVIILDINTGFTLLTTLGSDNNHTVSRTGTVDSCRSGILQNLHRSDIIGIDTIDTFQRNTVYNIKRSHTFGRESGSTTNFDRRRFTGLSGTGHHLYTGSSTLQCFKNISSHFLLNGLA